MPIRKTASLLKLILVREDYRQFGAIFAAMLLTAVLQVTGVASILPFMQLVATPGDIERHAWLSWLYESGGFATHRDMLLVLGVAVFVLFGGSVIATAITRWLIQRGAWSVAHRLSVRQLKIYMRLPYEFFLQNSSTELLRRIVADVNNFINDVLLASSQLLAHLVLALGLFVLLLFVNPAATLVAFAFFSGAYLLLHYLRHRFLVNLGRRRIMYDERRYRSFIDAITGMKAIRSSGSATFFVERFSRASKDYAGIYPTLEVTTHLPQFIMEIIAFGGILGLVIYLVAADGDFTHAIPMLTLFALATYRLMPALHTIFVSAARLSNSVSVIESVARDLSNGYPLEPVDTGIGEGIPFRHRIRLHRVSFDYAAASTPIVRDIDLSIDKGQWVALVGTTGSGKSTLIDILAGLLIPAEGDLEVDGRRIGFDQHTAWRRHIAYVPQEVFLYDDTIARNISFGDADPDPERLSAAARAANIDTFIMQELAQGYDTPIGERGIRLSGGQRQRIGIARAIYRRPEVLLLDEATSALDGITEAAIIRTLRETLPSVTVVMIAHRLTTVRLCDCIHIVDKGGIVAHGSYAELMASSPLFHSMATASESTGRDSEKVTIGG